MWDKGRTHRGSALAEVADSTREPGELEIIRADRTCIPEGTQVLARIERERRAQPECAGTTTVALGSVSLRGVLEESKPVPSGQPFCGS